MAQPASASALRRAPRAESVATDSAFRATGGIRRPFAIRSCDRQRSLSRGSMRNPSNGAYKTRGGHGPETRPGYQRACGGGSACGRAVVHRQALLTARNPGHASLKFEMPAHSRVQECRLADGEVLLVLREGRVHHLCWHRRGNQHSVARGFEVPLLVLGLSWSSIVGTSARRLRTFADCTAGVGVRVRLGRVGRSGPRSRGGAAKVWRRCRACGGCC